MEHGITLQFYKMERSPFINLQLIVWRSTCTHPVPKNLEGGSTRNPHVLQPLRPNRKITWFLDCPQKVREVNPSAAPKVCKLSQRGPPSDLSWFINQSNCRDIRHKPQLYSIVHQLKLRDQVLKHPWFATISQWPRHKVVGFVRIHSIPLNHHNFSGQIHFNHHSLAG